MLSLATLSFSPRSSPISSTTGETMWHGTHHSAQKSTRTGVSDSSTLAWNSVSFTSPMLDILVSSRSRWGACAGVLRLGLNARLLTEIPLLGMNVRLCLEHLLRIHRALASLSGRGHRLTIDPVGDIARRE